MVSRTLSVDPKKTNIDAIEEAVNILRSGGVIVYPSDTVYGLGSNALNSNAVQRIFRIKERSQDQSLPLAVSDWEMAGSLAFVDDRAKKLMNNFWPGALTIIMMKKPIVPSVVVGGGTSVGLRMPDHQVPLMLLRMSGLPIVSTSANKHGRPNSVEAEEAIRQIGGEVDLILDAGRVGGQPSTIIDITMKHPSIIRSGPVTKEMIENVIGPLGF
jgi:L-threonylcarbamoyladenylate synthase